MNLTEQEAHRLVRALGYGRHDQVDVNIDRELGRDDLVEVLRAGVATLLIEDYISEELPVIANDRRFDVWKRELEPRLVEPDVDRFYPEDFPDGYCYRAVLCRAAPAGGIIVLFRKYH